MMSKADYEKKDLPAVLRWALAPLAFLLEVLKCFAVFLVVGVALVLRRLKFLYPIYPSGLREFLRAWNDRMLWLTFRSFGRRIYVDTPCTVREPESYRPLIEAPPDFALTEDDVRSFYANGFLGPFTAFSEAEMAGYREEVRRIIYSTSETYGFVTGRDRHLDSPLMDEFMRQPAVVERIAQLLGPDLMVWRSQIFEKPAGAPEIGWHQGTTFLTEMLYKPALEPPDLDTIFEIGIWMAIDDATSENGCIQFVRGSHREIGTIKIAGGNRFHSAKFQHEYQIDPATVATPECRAGQFLIFSEKTIHGSPPNHSNHSRMAFVFRALRPDTQVFRGETWHRVAYYKKWFNLEKWGGVMIRGEDRYGVNRIQQPPPQPAAVEAA